MLHEASESVILTEDLNLQKMAEIRQHKAELEFLYECENSFQEQRAKVKWNTQGERNTKYFHAIVNKRYNHNFIRCL